MTEEFRYSNGARNAEEKSGAGLFLDISRSVSKYTRPYLTTVVAIVTAVDAVTNLVVAAVAPVSMDFSSVFQNWDAF